MKNEEEQKTKIQYVDYLRSMNAKTDIGNIRKSIIINIILLFGDIQFLYRIY